MKRRYFSIWIISAVLLLLAMTINNLFWVSASPEWDSKFTVNNWFGHWTGAVKDYTTIEKLNYYVFYRIVTVWTNWRDVGSAVVVGGIIVLFVIIRDLTKKKEEPIEV